MAKRSRKNKNVMKVSIVIPIYNVTSYIEECLQSVVNQSYKEIECILVDDCGNDDSIIKCEDFIKRYSGPIIFKIVHHKKNKGLSAARNTGTNIASGEYIYYLDSDDKLFSKSIELLVEETIKRPNVELVIGQTRANPMRRQYSLKNFHNIQYVNSPNWMKYNYFDVTKVFPVNAWNKLINKEFLISNNISFKEGLIHEDVLWMYWIALHAQKIAFVHQDTYFHLSTENSIMTTSTIERTTYNWGIILTEILQNLQEPYSKRAILFYYREFVFLYPKARHSPTYQSLYIAFKMHLKRRNMYCFFTILILYKKILSFIPQGHRFINLLLKEYFIIKNLKYTRVVNKDGIIKLS